MARSKIWLERDGKVVLSEWRVALLAAIDETGSLAAAAERLDLPYRTAWSKIKEIEDALEFRVLATQIGGAEGGGSVLTPEARRAVERFRGVAAGIEDLVRQRFDAEFGDETG